MDPLRALVARFSAEPYSGTLVRWGTELHDRFLLPFYAAADIAEVVDDLNRHGYAVYAMDLRGHGARCDRDCGCRSGRRRRGGESWRWVDRNARAHAATGRLVRDRIEWRGNERARHRTRRSREG